MADEFDDWKKQRTANDAATNTTASASASDMMQQDMAPVAAAPSGDVSSTRTERSSFSFMESSSSDGLMEVDEETVTPTAACIPQSSPLSSDQNNDSSWAMLNLKQWRRGQEHPQKSTHARQEMYRLWRKSSIDQD